MFVEALRGSERPLSHSELGLFGADYLRGKHGGKGLDTSCMGICAFENPYVCICIYIYMYTQVYVYIHTKKYIYIYIYIYIYTVSLGIRPSDMESGLWKS